MGLRRRRGKAEVRWGWSGVASPSAVPLALSDIDLKVLLPGHQSPSEEIVLELGDLGGRYHRYLHQDELGPTRAERMAALRSLLDQLDLLMSRLNGLPRYLCLRLSRRLASGCGSVECSIDKFQAYCNDEVAIHQVGEAASDDGSMRYTGSTRRDAELIDDVRVEQRVQFLAFFSAVSSRTKLPARSS